MSSTAQSMPTKTNSGLLADPLVQSTLDRLLEQIKQGAKEGNADLVCDRCDKIQEICSVGKAQALQSRSRTLATSSDPSSQAAGKKPGGVSYKPEYMLQIVLLADTLILSCTDLNQINVLNFNRPKANNSC